MHTIDIHSFTSELFYKSNVTQMRSEYFYQTKFKTRCAETNNLIMRGENILVSNGKAYCKDSKKYSEFLEAYNVKSYIDAQENAYFDRFCQNNNI